MDLLQKMLQYDPEKRISVEEALQHPFLNGDSIQRSVSPEEKRRLKERRQQSREEQAVLRTTGTKLQAVTLNPGEALFSKGDMNNDDIYFTRAGTFEVWDGDLFLGSVPAGDTVGEMSALLHH